MRDPFTSLPAPALLDDAPRASVGQEALALEAAGYREAPPTPFDERGQGIAWLRAMIDDHGHCSQ